MKTKELLDKIFENKSVETINGIGQYTMMPEHLKLYKDQLLKCEEFKDVEELIIIDHPSLSLGTKYEANMHSKTAKLGDNIKIKGTVYLYSISLTPEIYEPYLNFSQFKENALVTPIMYNYKDFTPYKYFMIKWAPESAQDIHGINHAPALRKSLHDKLDELIDDEEKYRIKGERGVMIRGVFDI